MTKARPDRFLVTGAASGIGRRLVDDLARRGHRILAADIAVDALEHIEDWPREQVIRQRLDVRNSEAWDAAMNLMAERWGGVDVVMNIAGFLRPSSIADCADDDVNRHIDVNLKGVVLGTRAAAKVMIEQKAGHIINVASLASMTPVPGLGLYVASKYAVRGFSMTAAQELREQGVAVTVVCTDAVRTPMLDLQADYPEAAITFTAPRFLEPEDISALILGRVLKKRPVIVSIPRSRAFLARLADLFPALATRLAAILAVKGRRAQAGYKPQI